jgi:dTDP-4-dehydrorhamnose 3,5-epimerase
MTPPTSEHAADTSGASTNASGYATGYPEAPVEPLIQGVVVRSLVRHGDTRGGFTETYRTEWFDGPPMLQGNRSDSAAGTIRGLHFHKHQSDYWLCLHGRLLVCLHDLRASSPTHGVTQGIVLTGDTRAGIYIPPGVLHGFGALEDSTLTYLVDNYYDATDEFGVRFDDPQVGFDWPIPQPILSERDRLCPTIDKLDPADLPG